MSGQSTCRHCGYAGPAEARYCARCGRRLASRVNSTRSRVNSTRLRARLSRATKRQPADADCPSDASLPHRAGPCGAKHRLGLVRAFQVLMARDREVRDLRQDLLARVQDAAIQQERSRLARELHDSIKQQIFGISFGAAAAQARWESDPQGARQAIDDVRRSAQEAMVEMNVLLQQLSPAPLEKVGLVQALRDQCEALGYRTGAEVRATFGVLPADDRLPAGAPESLFRIVQEAFSNIARHARADHVRFYLGQDDADGPLTLEIADDGQGFQVDQIEGGMGLENIRQRVRALGSRLALDSAPGGGTTLRVTIPLAEPIPFEEETGQGHALNKVFLVGLGGGLALIAALFYPLYVLLPGRSVAGWPGGSRTFGLALEIVTAALAVGIGTVAARWARAGTRQAGALCGALAGGVAGAVLYMGLGAAAASATGGRVLLERGLVPARDHAETALLLATATVGIVERSHQAFWIALLTGTGLGAIGGTLAPPVARQPHWPGWRSAVRAILTVAATASAISLWVTVSRFALLEPTIQAGLRIADGMPRVNSTRALATPGLANLSTWLMGTPAFLLAASLIALYALLRADIRLARVNSTRRMDSIGEDLHRLRVARTTAAFACFLSLGVPVSLAAMGSPAPLQRMAFLPAGWMDVTHLDHPIAVSIKDALGVPLLVGGLVAGLAMGGLYLAAMHAAYCHQRALDDPSPHPVYDGTIIAILISPGIIAWAARLVRAHAPSLQLAGVLIGLALAGVSILLIIRLIRISLVPGALAPTRPGWTPWQFIHASLGAAIAVVIPPMPVISIQVGMGLIANKLVEVLGESVTRMGYAHAAQEFTLVGLVHSVYLNQARACLLIFVGGMAAIGLTILILGGMAAIVEQLSTRSRLTFDGRTRDSSSVGTSSARSSE